MESRSSCYRCRKESVIELKYLGESLCSRCFTELFEKRVRKTIRLNKLLKHDDRIGVALSGGKDSASALYILKQLTDKIPSSRVVAVTIDLGIKGNRGAVKSAVKLCKSLDVEHHVYKLKDKFGFSMEDVVEKTKALDDGAPACSYCGVFKRKLLNDVGKELKLDKIATGHNLDDEVQTSLMNYVRGDFDRIARMGAFVGVLRDDGFVPRIKPLRECPEEEILAYAEIKELIFDVSSCPYSSEAFRQTARGIVNSLEENHPGSRFQLLNSTDKLREILREKKEYGKIKRCVVCGDLTSGKLCKTCEMMKKLDL